MLDFLKIAETLVLSCAIVGSSFAQADRSAVQTKPSSDPSVQPVPEDANKTEPTLKSRKTPEVLIGAGALIEVSVFGAPDFVKVVRVSSEGDISLPLIGRVKVAELPISEAERLVAKRLAEGGFFVDPQVSIFEKEYATQGVSVLGEVQKPGIYPMLGARTLFDALAAAGGTTPRAGNTVTITRRSLPEKPVTVPLSYGPTG